MVNNSKAFQIAKYAIMFATIFVAMMLDRAISVIPVPFSMAACVLLVTLSFCLLENSWLSGVLSGTFFGLASFLKEFLMPSVLIGQVFPPYYWLLITIPPRVLMGVAAFAVYRLMLTFTKKISNVRRRQTVCLEVSAFVGLVTNTLGFFCFLELARVLAGVEAQGVFYLIYVSLLGNILPEYAISLACVSFVVLGVRRGLKLGLEGNTFIRHKAMASGNSAANSLDVQTVEYTPETAEKPSDGVKTDDTALSEENLPQTNENKDGDAL